MPTEDMIDSIQSPTANICAKLSYGESCKIVIVATLTTLLTRLSSI